MRAIAGLNSGAISSLVCNTVFGKAFERIAVGRKGWAEEPHDARKRGGVRSAALPCDDVLRLFEARNYDAGCAGMCSSGLRCTVLPAVTYTFSSNCVRPAARMSIS